MSRNRPDEPVSANRAFETYWATSWARKSAQKFRREAFLCADSPNRTCVRHPDGVAGSRVLVTRGLPSPSCARGWQWIDGTKYYARMIPQ